MTKSREVERLDVMIARRDTGANAIMIVAALIAHCGVHICACASCISQLPSGTVIGSVCGLDAKLGSRHSECH